MFISIIISITLTTTTTVNYYSLELAPDPPIIFKPCFQISTVFSLHQASSQGPTRQLRDSHPCLPGPWMLEDYYANEGGLGESNIHTSQKSPDGTLDMYAF